MATHSKLAVILHADVVGSTSLVQHDERIAHDRMQEAFAQLSETITRFGGVVHEVRGDALVAEFNRASDATSASLAFQLDQRARNQAVSDDIRPVVRIGLALGEVVIADRTVTGTGVVLAQRLEQLAEPGGVCVQAAVQGAIPKRFPFDYTDLGDQSLKGFDDPVRTFTVSLRAGQSIPIPELDVLPARKGRSWRRTWFAGGVAATALLALGWFGLAELDRATDAGQQPHSRETERPSIAVLPFSNLSDEAQQEFFADGMTEDLITDLSKLAGLNVIARNSVFAYKGETIDPKRVAEALGVMFILKGSVRRAGGRVRINAQLIDGATNENVWAERYDGSNEDVFTLQDQVVGKIVSALELELSSDERAQLGRIPTANMEAYDLYLRGRRSLWSRTTDGRRDALKHFQRAIGLDPGFADAYAAVARVASDLWRQADSTVLPRVIARKLAYQASGKALALDPKNAEAYAVLAHQQITDGRHDDAVQSIEKAVALQPGDAEIRVDLANILVYAGRPQEALAAVELAFQLEPNPPPSFYAERGAALFANRQYHEAVAPLERALSSGDERLEPLAKVYARLGRTQDAEQIVDKLLEVFPGASLTEYRSDESRLFKRAEDLEHSIESLRIAGLPEWPFGYDTTHLKRLLDADIQPAVFGKTWSGKDVVNGGPFIQETRADGTVAFRSGYSLVTGRAWVEADRLCIHFPTYGEDHRLCGYLFRDPAGSSDAQNTHVLIGETQILQFATEPLEDSPAPEREQRRS